MKKKWITKLSNKEDVKIALICVLAASIFWFFNAMNDNYTTTIDYPIEVVYDSKRIIQTEPILTKVNINVSGYGWQIFGKELGLGKKPCVINITDPSRQKHITSSQLRSLIANQIDKIQVNYVENDTLFLFYDWLVTKRINLTLKTCLDKNKYALKQAIFFPDHIQLEGASLLLEKLKDTIGIQIKDVDQGEEVRDYPISLNEYFSDQFKLNTSSATANVFLYHYQEQQLEVPISIINYDDNEIDYHNHLTLSYFVREDSSHYVDDNSFEAIIDYTKIKNDSSVTVELEKKPHFIRVKKLTPQTVKFLK